MKNSALCLKNHPFLILSAVVCLQLAAGVSSGFASGGSITVIPDGSVIIQIVNFIVLIWLLNLLLYKPIRNILIKRKDKITGLEQRIEKLNIDSDNCRNSLADGIKSARGEGLKKKEILLAEGSREEKEIIAKINEKVQAEIEGIRQKLIAEAKDVKASLQKEVDDYASAIGKKILGREI